MKFNKALKEAAAEVVGQGNKEKIKIYLNNKEIYPGEVRGKYPAIYKVVMKAVDKAKTSGFNIAPEKSPADITLKANGDIILTSDDGKNQKRFTLEQLGLDPKMVEKAKSILNKIG